MTEEHGTSAICSRRAQLRARVHALLQSRDRDHGYHADLAELVRIEDDIRRRIDRLPDHLRKLCTDNRLGKVTLQRMNPDEREAGTLLELLHGVRVTWE